ncbi:AMP-dependent synthetase and ligase protein [Rutstroemia sp. NJR-2017a BBW]|nr:AMP-dependent synthetase and ligase protein [Rutstroemia sp. NJR-2017a BBW]
MATERYSLAEVMAIAELHPFYNGDVKYPLTLAEISNLQELGVVQKKEHNIKHQPLLRKKTLYKVIERLTNDLGPRNTYRQGCYISITGGGSGGVPMMFAVDAHENRRQRAQMGKLLKLCGVLNSEDMVLSTHLAGGFYRSLDLMTEIIENAGATAFSAGAYMAYPEVVRCLMRYHVNVFTGDSGQVVQVVHHISMLPEEDRKHIILNKIIYTSESLTTSQREFIRTVLGDIKIFSIMASCEAGPWTLSSPDITGEHNLTGNSTDFVFDTRSMLIEIFSLSALDDPDGSSPSSHLLSEGETGIIVQTSLQRLRNPLVRYVSGDIGSVHPLPDSACAVIPESERKHLRVLRMKGRDSRFSFEWYAEYFEFQSIDAFMQAKEHGVLQWQIILARSEDTPQATLEIRFLRCPPRDGVLSEESFLRLVETFFVVLPENEHLIRIVFLDSLKGFERSSTAGKVIRFVDRWNGGSTAR